VLFRERSYLLPIDGDHAEYHVVSDKGHLQSRSRTTEIDQCSSLRVPGKIWLLGSKVDILNGRPLTLKEEVRRGVRSGDYTRMAQIAGVGCWNAKQCFDGVAIAFKNPQPSERRFAEQQRSFEHCIEHRGELNGGRTDDLQHL